MKINKIVLYNFNSYEGLNEFDFTSENSSKNIILIGGKNGAGKTSLFMAIKLALYGPLSFGYVGINPKYIAKIKDCINSRAFQKDVVKSKVQISVSLMVEREIKEYEITREWNYAKQKLDEKYYVKTEDRILDGQELSYFQNYLQSMIPPDLFEFFLFDGEEVGSVFSTSTYNYYVKNAVYTNTELIHLIKNLGKDVFASEIGKQGMELLYKKYKVCEVSQLQQVLEVDNQNSTYDLYKRVDISRLSKGERQIFILSLYWAIIELSGQDIPFIIDTPYARIDANHRKEISEKFFPSISKQVVILSTDEEINEEYYEIIKPYIAKEYLLINDESQNRTTVEQHYFFEE